MIREYGSRILRGIAECFGVATNRLLGGKTGQTTKNNFRFKNIPMNFSNSKYLSPLVHGQSMPSFGMAAVLLLMFRLTATHDSVLKHGTAKRSPCAIYDKDVEDELRSHQITALLSKNPTSVRCVLSPMSEKAQKEVEGEPLN